MFLGLPQGQNPTDERSTVTLVMAQFTTDRRKGHQGNKVSLDILLILIPAKNAADI